MAILNNNPLVGASGNQGGYNINNSLRFRSSASAYLSRTPSSTPTSFTISVWLKRGTLSAYQSIMYSRLAGSSVAGGNNGLVFDANNAIVFSVNSADAGKTTTAVFRDPSAWYHIVVNYNGSGTSAIYVNGVQQTTTGSNTGTNKLYNSTGGTNAIGRYGDDSSAYFDGYMAEFNFIDGSVKTPSDFGETDTTTGVWKPKAYTGTYGTNGFYLKFSDIATTSGSNAGLGKDFSGNSNYWTTNNISVTAGTTYDAMTDVPTNTSATVANYAVLNPLSKGTNVSITNANLAASYGSAAWTSAFGTIGVSTGKWYWEITLTSAGTDAGVGISTNPAGSANSYIGGDANSWGYYASNGNKWNNNSQTSYGATYANGDVIGIALDLDAGTLVFYKNNVSQGTAFSSLASNTYFPALSVNNSSFAANFGQRPFTYTPPTGFVALNTFNLPTSTIVKGNTVMDATLWTGNGSSQSIVNASGFKPDFVWVKSRSNTFNNNLFNSTSGVNKFLVSDTTAAEASVTGTLTAFNSNGFSVGSDIGLNYSGGTYVGWQWQAGQGSTSSNTSGSITSTVSVNTTAGFSIVTYTGNGSASQSIGHGLGVAPKWIIVKARSNGVYSWGVYHVTQGNTKYALLNTTDAFATSAQIWASTTPTSSVFYVGSDLGTNKSGDTYVAYCWAEIAGFSKFGSYTGNGSTDGPFVYLGFRPKYIMVKRTDSTGEWGIHDSVRDTYNVVSNVLLAENSTAEIGGLTFYDFTSNGFKLRNSNANRNASGATYIYMAFAENPTKFALAR